MRIEGIIKTPEGFLKKDFKTGEILGPVVLPPCRNYEEALAECRKFIRPASMETYLRRAFELNLKPDADVWENLIYAEDPRGVWDGEREIYRDVTSMDRGAATEEEIAYVDALDAAYQSMRALLCR